MKCYLQLNLFVGLLSVLTGIGIANIAFGETPSKFTDPTSKGVMGSQVLSLETSKMGRVKGKSVKSPASRLKPTPSAATKPQSLNVKPTPSTSTSRKPTNLKPQAVKPQSLQPAHLPIATLRDSGIHRSPRLERSSIILYADRLRAILFDPIVVPGAILNPTPPDPTVFPKSKPGDVEETRIQVLDTSNLESHSSRHSESTPDHRPVRGTQIHPTRLTVANRQAASLAPSQIHPARLQPENRQAASLRVSPIQSVIGQVERLSATPPETVNPRQRPQPSSIKVEEPNSTSRINVVEQPLSSPNRNQSPIVASSHGIRLIAANTKQNDDTSPEERQIQVQEINVTGSTIFGEAEFNPIIEPVEGNTVTLEELRSVADTISQLYLEQGYITSRAVLVEETLDTDVVEIRVIEGSLEEIQVEGTRRLNPSYVRSRVRLGADTPLNTGALEDQLRLLRVNPLFENVEASLRAGTGLGQSILVVRISEADPFEGSVGIDNYSPPSVGAERFTTNARYINLTGIGDAISAQYNRTTAGGAYTWDFNYRAPINAMNGTVQLRASFNENEVIQENLQELDIQGESELYEINYRQPLIRTPRRELALSLGFTHQDGQTFTFAGPTPFGFGPDEDGVSRTSVFKFGQEYTLRQTSGAWAFRSLFSFGTGLFDATENSDVNSDVNEDYPDGQFVSWLAQIQRVQIINPDNFLIIQADLQLAFDSLLPAQQFVIGGGQSVRGYRQNVRAGDNGFRISVEDRITLERDESGIATFVLAPFFDVGYVWNRGTNPNELLDQTFIAGLGLGILWEPLPNLNLRLDYGLPLVDLDDRGENAQDDGFYFSVNYNF
ncbi:MAG: ShlB/FhaC/HecB family hemolysin secretion/activation protein [Coleofasciculus chthonoplastes F3-SA18-01]|uniref:ShlB/FhaC/HecB family hemolysin secretion/activation protein n=1 Tax=Coleofasciculus chthonoplastes TaxID=64178 RepID=UPI0032FE94C4